MGLIAEDRVFTPRFQSGKRLHVRISKKDWLKIGRGLNWLGRIVTVTVEGTGERITVKGAECSAPGCYCDALILTIKPWKKQEKPK